MAEIVRTKSKSGAIRAILVALACACVALGCLSGFSSNETPEDAQTVAAIDDDKEYYESNVDWDKLIAENSDVAAWVSIPDTDVSYPVYVSDEPDYYLHHNRDGEYSKFGEIYLDAGCPGIMTGQSTILFGHHITYGEPHMFESVSLYSDKSWGEDHDTCWVETREGKAYKCKLRGVSIVEGTDKVNRGTFTDQADFTDWYKDRLSDCEYVIDGPIPDKVLALATCSYHYSNNERTIVYFAVEQVLDVKYKD